MSTLCQVLPLCQSILSNDTAGGGGVLYLSYQWEIKWIFLHAEILVKSCKTRTDHRTVITTTHTLQLHKKREKNVGQFCERYQVQKAENPWTVNIPTCLSNCVHS